MCVSVSGRERGLARKARELRTDEERMKKSCAQAYFVYFQVCVCVNLLGSAYVQVHASLFVAGEGGDLV